MDKDESEEVKKLKYFVATMSMVVLVLFSIVPL